MSFAYPSRPNRVALRNVSLFFPAGDTTFVVGKSGSGKSTISNLLLQFYSSASGEITIDGEHIETLDTSWLRNNITLVQQKTILFNETIFKNIALGHANHDRVQKHDVLDCIRFASLGTTITQLPQGLDTLVSISGSSMSGGQRQRIAIARARLRDSPVLILDEATSALDHTNATIIMQNLREWRKNKTTIIITHNVSQVLSKDYVYVLDKGRVVQEGYQGYLEDASGSPFSNLLSPHGLLHRHGDGSGLPSSLGPREASGCGLEVSQNDNDMQPPQPLKPTHARSSGATQFGVENLKASLGPANAHLSRMSDARMSIHPLLTYKTKKDTSMTSLGISPTKGEKDLSTRMSFAAPQDPSRQSGDTSVATLAEELSYNPDLSDSNQSGEEKHTVTGASRPTSKANPSSSSTLPLREIFRTVWPNLTRRARLALIAGLCFTLVHAAATPLFSWVFSRLLGTFFAPADARPRMSFIWSMAILCIAIADAIVSCLMHLLLEVCGQAWVDSLRTTALRRIMDQPQSWFDMEKNNVQGFGECLDRDAEEMRNLVGRFGAFILVAVFMMLLAFVWSMVVCWRLTLVGLATAPLVYAITRSFEAASGRLERTCNNASDSVGAIFAETFGNIRIVRALTLEGYFHRKYAKATKKAMKAGMRRAVISGLLFGITDSSLVFVIGMLILIRSLPRFHAYKPQHFSCGMAPIWQLMASAMFNLSSPFSQCSSSQ